MTPRGVGNLIDLSLEPLPAKFPTEPIVSFPISIFTIHASATMAHLFLAGGQSINKLRVVLNSDGSLTPKK
jgi:hypothetical protein